VNILVVEDERRVASFLLKGLRAQGYETVVVATGNEALELVRRGGLDGVLLDLKLPDIDGLDVLRSIRSEGMTIPVLILTARAEVDDRVKGLELGADDYVTKPFDFDEVLARLRLRLRPRQKEPPGTLGEAGTVLDLRSRRAVVDGAEIELTLREFSLLEVLMRHPGQVLSHDQLLVHAWGDGRAAAANVVDVYVGYLRRKIGSERIETVRGVGFRFVTGSDAR
jgi:DNA-binding response OmpR family regulator